jgi:hypothetical protein
MYSVRVSQGVRGAVAEEEAAGGRRRCAAAAQSGGPKAYNKLDGLGHHEDPYPGNSLAEKRPSIVTANIS